MSYILDALKKSEQQRQAIQPDTVNERILVNPLPAQQKPNTLLIAMIAFNLLALSGLIWFMYKHYGSEALQTAGENTSEAAVKFVKADPEAVIKKEVLIKTDTGRHPENASGQQSKSLPSDVSLAQILEEKNSVPKTVVPAVKTEGTAGKKPAPAKKERSVAEPAGQKKQKPALDGAEAVTPVRSIQNASHEGNWGEFSSATSVSPKLTINVFSYAQKPEDRFVIIDMVKYKIGQHVKGGVKLKEIRSDSIVLEDSKGTFTVDRP